MPQQKALLLRHNFREGNKVAHLLAKDAAKEQFKQPKSKVTRLHAYAPHFVTQQLISEQSGKWIFVKSLPTTVCNMLRTVGNQNISCDIPPTSGSYPMTCNKQNYY